MEFLFARFASFPLKENNEILLSKWEKGDSFEIKDELLNSIYFSSPNFYEVLKTNGRKIYPANTDFSKIDITTYKYLVRAIFKPTPFGFFGTLANATFLDNSSYLISDKKRQAVFLNYLSSQDILDKALEKSKTHFSFSKYRLNNTIHKVGPIFRFISRKKYYGNFHFIISEIQSNPFIESLVSMYKDKTFYVEQILKEYEYINEEKIKLLIDCQFIYLNNQFSLKQGEYEKLVRSVAYQNLNLKFDKIPPFGEFNEGQLIEINDSISKSLFNEGINYKGPHLKINNYRIGDPVSIDNSIRKKIFQAAEILFLQTNRRANNKTLNSFVEKFKTIYQEGVYYRLVDVLDNDTGIGIEFKNNFDNRYFKFTDPTSKLKLDLFMLSKLNNSNEVELTKNQIEILKKDNKQFSLPNMLTFTGEIYKDKFGNEAVSNISFVSSISNLIGRFTEESVLDLSNFEQLKKQLISENENVIFADINFSPNPIFSNITNRNSIFDYEICYLFESPINDIKKIYFDDLYITHVDEDIILYSESFQKQVIPVLSNAISYKVITNPIFRFLCEIQNHNSLENLCWDWEFLNNEIFLPRVVFNGIILAESRWRLHLDLFKLKGSIIITDFIYSFNQLKDQFSIPNVFYLQNGEDRLLINISLPLCYSILKSELEKNKQLILIECLLTEFQSPFKDAKNNKYCNEIMFSFLTTNFNHFDNYQIRNYGNLTPKFITQKNINSFFLPYSKWNYLKVYMPEIHQDSFLVYLLIFFHSVSNAMPLKWFFVRYIDDAGSHLRLRILNEFDRKFDLQTLITHIKAFTNFSINKIQIDTYEREIYRYNYQIEIFEVLFCINSNFVTLLLEKIQGSKVNFDFKPILAFINTLFLYKNTLSLDETIKELSKNVDYFEIEFDIKNKPNLKSEINMQYIFFREIFISKKIKNKGEIENKLFSESLLLTDAFIVKYTNTILNGDKLLPNSFSSFIHMFHNRIFDKNQRKFEFYINTFCLRFFKEIKARDLTILNNYFD